MLKKCWGIVLWGLVFLFLGIQIFSLQVYYARGVDGREKSFSSEIPQYFAKLELIKKNTANIDVQKQFPQLENECSTRLITFQNLLRKAHVFKFYFPIVGIICILAGLGLILRIEIARKIAGILPVILTAGSLLTINIALDLNRDGGRLGKIDSAINCYLKNEASVPACGTYLNDEDFKIHDSKTYLEASLPIAVAGILFSGIAIWYFSRKKIKEQFR